MPEKRRLPLGSVDVKRGRPSSWVAVLHHNAANALVEGLVLSLRLGRSLMACNEFHKAKPTGRGLDRQNHAEDRRDVPSWNTLARVLCLKS